MLADEIRACRACELGSLRRHAVPGSGPVPASIMGIAEAPGAYEDNNGLPFQGDSGEVLDQLLAGAGLSRRDIFLTNVLKCRPPRNRDPKESEYSICTQLWMARQIEEVQPKLIIAMGRFAAGLFMERPVIARVHGQLLMTDEGRWYVPMYHPAAGFRNNGVKNTIEVDWKQLPDMIRVAMGGEKPVRMEVPEPAYL